MPLIVGTPGHDYIVGSQGDDEIRALDGDDFVNGRGGDDWIFGGWGRDDLIGGTGFNDYWGGPQFDIFIMSQRSGAGFSNDLIHDFEFNIDLVDLSRWGVSDFGQVRALLDFSRANATFNAFYAGLNHSITLLGIAPQELVSADFIYSNAGPKSQTGTGARDVLFGSRYGDTLNGAAGGDTLLGGRGNDKLIGTSAKDIFAGGADLDRFDFNALSDSAKGANRDVIRDFNRAQGDKIDLSTIDADQFGTPGNQAFKFIGTSGFHGIDGELRCSGGIVQADVNGDRIADFEIKVNLATLRADDFVL